MSVVGEQRFNWINGFVSAWLVSISYELGLTEELPFSQLHQRFCLSLQEKIQSTDSSLSTSSLPHKNIVYLFHLESELWGSEGEKYICPSRPLARDIAQTFLFPHSFFLLERWLELFVEREKEEGRLKVRNKLFGEKGFFSKECPQLLEFLGFPFHFVWCSPTKARQIQSFQKHKEKEIPKNLSFFYKKTTGKTHYCEILEASFQSTKRKLSRRISKRVKQKERRKVSRQLSVYFYDVWWMYSESMRYRDLALSPYLKDHPYHWNRVIRWATSLNISALCALLQALTKNALSPFWKEAWNSNPILQSLFTKDRDGICP